MANDGPKKRAARNANRLAVLRAALLLACGLHALSRFAFASSPPSKWDKAAFGVTSALGVAVYAVLHWSARERRGADVRSPAPALACVRLIPTAYSMWLRRGGWRREAWT